MAKRDRTDPFARLSPAEKAHFGSAQEWRLAGTVPPRKRRPESAQFSLRIQKSEMETLEELSREAGTTFSEVVRDAIRQYIGSGSRGGLPTTVVSLPQIRVIVRSGRGVVSLPRTLSDVELAEPRDANTTLASIA